MNVEVILLDFSCLTGYLIFFDRICTVDVERSTGIRQWLKRFTKIFASENDDNMMSWARTINYGENTAVWWAIMAEKMIFRRQI